MTIQRAVVILAVLLAAARPVAAQRFMYSGCPDADVLSFVAKLQKAVGAGDRSTVAGMVRYPLRVNRDAAHHILVAGVAELMKQYDAVFTPTIRQAIVAEKLATMSGGRDGVAIKAGLVWIAGMADSVRPARCRLGISSVNLQGEK
jgi:hypothetical protein